MYTDRLLLSKNQRNQFPLTVSGESHHVFPTTSAHWKSRPATNIPVIPSTCRITWQICKSGLHGISS